MDLQETNPIVIPSVLYNKQMKIEQQIMVSQLLVGVPAVWKNAPPSSTVQNQLWLITRCYTHLLHLCYNFQKLSTQSYISSLHYCFLTFFFFICFLLSHFVRHSCRQNQQKKHSLHDLGFIFERYICNWCLVLFALSFISNIRWYLYSSINALPRVRLLLVDHDIYFALWCHWW